jgi:type IV secretion system protein VirB10
MIKSGDERTSNVAVPQDIRPIVGADRGNRSLWIALGSIGFLGLLLFLNLENQRVDRTAPAIRPRASDFSARPGALPTLYVPPEPIFGAPISVVRPPVADERALVRGLPLTIKPNPRPLATVPNYSPPPPQFLTQPAPAETYRTGPVIVYDVSGSNPGSSVTAGAAGEPTPQLATARRAMAARPANRVATVPQGTLIPAVLETALDSTQPGQARALVSDDITNLNGDRILIPRGSRLFGEYRGDISPGQKRIQLLWARLVRPDGVTIDLNSPSTDKLGRAGLRGKVNTHFFERLGGALLQTVIDFGSIVASRSISDSAVIVAVPSSAQGAVSQLIPPVAKPSIRVSPGTSVSVFVARDLDFSTVEVGF